MAAGDLSHAAVDPTTSVKQKVTVPDGRGWSVLVSRLSAISPSRCTA
jgi:hypothetical protein